MLNSQFFMFSSSSKQRYFHTQRDVFEGFQDLRHVEEGSKMEQDAPDHVNLSLPGGDISLSELEQLHDKFKSRYEFEERRRKRDAHDATKSLKQKLAAADALLSSIESELRAEREEKARKLHDKLERQRKEAKRYEKDRDEKEKQWMSQTEEMYRMALQQKREERQRYLAGLKKWKRVQGGNDAPEADGMDKDSSGELPNSRKINHNSNGHSNGQRSRPSSASAAPRAVVHAQSTAPADQTAKPVPKDRNSPVAQSNNSDREQSATAVDEFTVRAFPSLPALTLSLGADAATELAITKALTSTASSTVFSAKTNASSDAAAMRAQSMNALYSKAVERRQAARALLATNPPPNLEKGKLGDPLLAFFASTIPKKFSMREPAETEQTEPVVDSDQPDPESYRAGTAKRVFTAPNKPSFFLTETDGMNNADSEGTVTGNTALYASAVYDGYYGRSLAFLNSQQNRLESVSVEAIMPSLPKREDPVIPAEKINISSSLRSSLQQLGVVRKSRDSWQSPALARGMRSKFRPIENRLAPGDLSQPELDASDREMRRRQIIEEDRAIRKEKEVLKEMLRARQREIQARQEMMTNMVSQSIPRLPSLSAPSIGASYATGVSKEEASSAMPG